VIKTGVVGGHVRDGIGGVGRPGNRLETGGAVALPLIEGRAAAAVHIDCKRDRLPGVRGYTGWASFNDGAKRVQADIVVIDRSGVVGKKVECLNLVQPGAPEAALPGMGAEKLAIVEFRHRVGRQIDLAPDRKSTR